MADSADDVPLRPARLGQFADHSCIEEELDGPIFYRPACRRQLVAQRFNGNTRLPPVQQTAISFLVAVAL